MLRKHVVDSSTVMTVKEISNSNLSLDPGLPKKKLKLGSVLECGFSVFQEVA